jgi:hypothetical protein
MIRLYSDEKVEGAIITGLRMRGIDVLTAVEDGYARTDDSLVLDRAGTLGRVAFSRDQDFLRDARRRQVEGRSFVGVIYAEKGHVTIGECIRNLEVIASVGVPEDFANVVWYLPL